MKAVGASVPRYDGIKNVVGRALFTDDVRPAGLLHVKLLRSPHDSARIVSLDVTGAAAAPGVRGVITAADVPRLIVGQLEAQGIAADEPLLAQDEVRFRGQPIVAVAAESEDAARDALERISIEYEVREPFLDMRLALDPDQPHIVSDGNLFHYEKYTERRVRRGDVDRAFEEADLIVEGVYRPTAIEQAPLETQAAIADALGYDRGTLVGLLDELEEQELIERKRCPDDRRRHAVRITAGGTRMLGKFRALNKRLEDEFLAPLDAEQRETLHELLLTLAALHEPRCAPPPVAG